MIMIQGQCPWCDNGQIVEGQCFQCSRVPQGLGAPLPEPKVKRPYGSAHETVATFSYKCNNGECHQCTGWRTPPGGNTFKDHAPCECGCHKSRIGSKETT